MLCPVCDNLDSECGFCEDNRAQLVARQNRRAEAIEWMNRNMTQQIRGEPTLLLPNDPEEMIMLVMSIIAYARDGKIAETDEPAPTERFQRLETRGGSHGD